MTDDASFAKSGPGETETERNEENFAYHTGTIMILRVVKVTLWFGEGQIVLAPR